MGKVGTDRMDQVVASYYRNTRFYWPVKTMTHMVGIAMMNAYITYMDVSGMAKKDLSYLEFIMSVCDELNAPVPSSQYQSSGRPAPGHTHTPEMHGRPKRAFDAPLKPFGQKKENSRPTRRDCVVCSSTCSSRCIECGVFVHFNTVASGKKCWATWHARNPLVEMD